MRSSWNISQVVLLLGMLVMLPLSGCDEYEREQIRQAGDDINAAGDHIGNASGSALDRARNSTGDALRNLGDKIDAHQQNVQDAADQKTTD